MVAGGLVATTAVHRFPVKIPPSSGLSPGFPSTRSETSSRPSPQGDRREFPYRPAQLLSPAFRHRRLPGRQESPGRKSAGHLPEPRGPVGDEGTHELGESPVVLELLFPADEQSPKPVHPRDGPLHHRAAGLAHRVPLHLLLPLASRPYLGHEVVGLEDIARLRAVVPRVQAHVPGGSPPRPDRAVLQRCLRHLEVVAIGPGHGESRMTSAPSVGRLCLVPFFALSVGFGPVSSPPRGALDMAPSMDAQVQLIPPPRRKLGVTTAPACG